MKKIIVLVLFSTALFADTDLWVYTYDDASVLKDVFNYLAMISKDGGYLGLVSLSVTVGFIISHFINMFKPLNFVKTFFITTVIIGVALGKTTTVNVENVKAYTSTSAPGRGYAKIDDVPYIFAAITSAFTHIGYYTGLLVEDMFAAAAGDDYANISFFKAGANGGVKAATDLNNIDLSHIDKDAAKFASYHREYLQTCIFGIAYKIDPDALTKVMNSTNLFEAINPNGGDEAPDGVKNIKDEEVDTTLGRKTCGDFYNIVKDQRDNIDQDKIDDYVKALYKDYADPIKTFGSTAKLMAKTKGDDPSAAMRNYIMATSYRMAHAKAVQGLQVESESVSAEQGAFAAGSILGRAHQMTAVNAQSASIFIPANYSVLQALFYVFFPIILLVLIVSNSMMILKNYILALLWIELWIPAYAAVSYFVNKDTALKATDFLVKSVEGFSPSDPTTYVTIANQYEYMNLIATQAAVGAEKLWMVPMLAGFMLFASFQAISGVTGAIANTVSATGNVDAQMDEKAKTAAFDKVKKEIEANNPLYTGKTGSGIGLGTVMQKSLESQYTSETASRMGEIEALGSKLAKTKLNKSSINATTEGSTYTGKNAVTSLSASSLGRQQADDMNANASAYDDSLKTHGIDSYRYSRQFKSLQEITNTFGEKTAYDKFAQENNLTDLNGDGKVNGADTVETFKTHEATKKLASQDTTQKIADKITGKTGDESLARATEMMARAGVTYADKQGTHKVSFDGNNNIVDSSLDSNNIKHHDSINTQNKLHQENDTKEKITTDAEKEAFDHRNEYKDGTGVIAGDSTNIDDSTKYFKNNISEKIDSEKEYKEVDTRDKTSSGSETLTGDRKTDDNLEKTVKGKTEDRYIQDSEVIHAGRKTDLDAVSYGAQAANLSDSATVNTKLTTEGVKEVGGLVSNVTNIIGGIGKFFKWGKNKSSGSSSTTQQPEPVKGYDKDGYHKNYDPTKLEDVKNYPKHNQGESEKLTEYNYPENYNKVHGKGAFESPTGKAPQPTQNFTQNKPEHINIKPYKNPKSNQSSASTNGNISRTVEKGDTVYSLAQKYNTTKEEIMRKNPNLKEDKDGIVWIYPGDKLNF